MSVPFSMMTHLYLSLELQALPQYPCKILLIHQKTLILQMIQFGSHFSVLCFAFFNTINETQWIENSKKTYLMSSVAIFSSIRFVILRVALLQLTRSGVATLSKFAHAVTSSLSSPRLQMLTSVNSPNVLKKIGKNRNIDIVPIQLNLFSYVLSIVPNIWKFD